MQPGRAQTQIEEELARQRDVFPEVLPLVAALSVFRTRLNMLSTEQSGVPKAPLRLRPSSATWPGDVA